MPCFKGPFKCYVMQMGVGGGIKFSGKKRYEGVRFNVISVTRGWVGVQFPGKKRYLTLEWPLTTKLPHPMDRNTDQNAWIIKKL